MRGLKSVSHIATVLFETVAPLVGAWIEMLGVKSTNFSGFIVAPLVGAWIEIIM